MDKNEAIIRYAMQHGKLDDLKVWLLNGGSVNEYFTSHKQNIKSKRLKSLKNGHRTL